MIVINSDPVIYFDVDDTLVIWHAASEDQQKYGVEFTCPGTRYIDDDTGKMKQYPSYKQILIPHQKHIEQLKKHKARGDKIVVWSAGGWEWAESVVKTLGLESHVDLVISKPTWFYDDLPAEEFMHKISNCWVKDYYMEEE